MPTRVPPDPDLVLTAQQRRVLDQLARHLDPVKVTVLAEELSLHHNTVREHLDVLIEHELAERRPVRSGGRGRPAWAYVAVAAAPHRRVAEYLDLAGAFAEHLSATSAHPRAEARDIGRRWGERLAAPRARRHADSATPHGPEPVEGGHDASPLGEQGRAIGARPVDSVDEVDKATVAPPAADGPAPTRGSLVGGVLADDPDGTADRVPTSRHRLIRLLREVGFAPDSNAERDDVALRECPLLDSARVYPDVVCQVHQGLVVGALAAYGNTTDVARLTPFAEPGACRLRLRRRKQEQEQE